MVSNNLHIAKFYAPISNNSKEIVTTLSTLHKKGAILNAVNNRTIVNAKKVNEDQFMLTATAGKKRTIFNISSRGLEVIKNIKYNCKEAIELSQVSGSAILNKELQTFIQMLIKSSKV